MAKVALVTGAKKGVSFEVLHLTESLVCLPVALNNLGEIALTELEDRRGARKHKLLRLLMPRRRATFVAQLLVFQARAGWPLD